MHDVTVDEINGRWFARAGDHILAGPFGSHSAAWRWVDRHSGSPISRSEHVAEWIWNKIVVSRRRADVANVTQTRFACEPFPAPLMRRSWGCALRRLCAV